MSSGAFSSVTAERDMEVSLADDANAYLAMMPVAGPNAEYVDTSEGTLSLTLDSVNKNATTEFDDLFKVLNQGTQAVGVYFDAVGGKAVTFRSNDSSIEGKNEAVTLGVGETMTVGLTVDLVDHEFSQVDTVNVNADASLTTASKPAPTSTIYAEDYDSLSAAVTAAESGTEVVATGTYTEDVTVSTSGIVLSGDGATLTGGIALSADDVTVDGFTIDGGSYVAGGNAGVYVNGTSGHTISNNTFLGADNTSSASVKDAVLFTTDSGISGVTISGNTFDGWFRGAYFNEGNTATVTNNVYSNNGVGIAGIDGGTEATLLENRFSGNTIEAVGVGDGGMATLRRNELEGDVNNYGTSTTVDAAYNWWGTASGPSAGRTKGDVDTEPFLTEPVFKKTYTVGSDGSYTTIEDALDAARPGETIELGSETYVEEYHSSTGIRIDTDGVTIRGNGESVIDTTNADERGITVQSRGVTFEGFTLLGPAPGANNGYGFKIQNEDVTVRNVTVEGSAKTELDLIDASGAVVENVDLLGDDTAGVGLSIRRADGVEISDITTRNNGWGGVAVYAEPGEATKNVTISGNNSYGEALPFYTESNGGTIENVSQSDFGWTVTTDASGSENFVFYFATKADAEAFIAASEDFTTSNSTISQL